MFEAKYLAAFDNMLKNAGISSLGKLYGLFHISSRESLFCINGIKKYRPSTFCIFAVCL